MVTKRFCDTCGCEIPYGCRVYHQRVTYQDSFGSNNMEFTDTDIETCDSCNTKISNFRKTLTPKESKEAQ